MFFLESLPIGWSYVFRGCRPVLQPPEPAPFCLPINAKISGTLLFRFYQLLLEGNKEERAHVSAPGVRRPITSKRAMSAGGQYRSGESGTAGEAGFGLRQLVAEAREPLRGLFYGELREIVLLSTMPMSRLMGAPYQLLGGAIKISDVHLPAVDTYVSLIDLLARTPNPLTTELVREEIREMEGWLQSVRTHQAASLTLFNLGRKISEAVRMLYESANQGSREAILILIDLFYAVKNLTGAFDGLKALRQRGRADVTSTDLENQRRWISEISVWIAFSGLLRSTDHRIAKTAESHFMGCLYPRFDEESIDLMEEIRHQFSYPTHLDFVEEKLEREVRHYPPTLAGAIIIQILHNLALKGHSSAVRGLGKMALRHTPGALTALLRLKRETAGEVSREAEATLRRLAANQNRVVALHAAWYLRVALKPAG